MGSDSSFTISWCTRLSVRYDIGRAELSWRVSLMDCSEFFSFGVGGGGATSSMLGTEDRGYRYL